MNSVNDFHVARATLNDIDDLEKLFDEYRIFYRQVSNRMHARDFLTERIVRDESVIFLARDLKKRPFGFTQLYPCFSSVAATRIWILNDLFVYPNARRHGVGKALANAARDHALETRAARLVLSTARDNMNAQRLYESLGYARDSHDGMFEYSLTL